MYRHIASLDRLACNRVARTWTRLDWVQPWGCCCTWPLQLPWGLPFSRSSNHHSSAFAALGCANAYVSLKMYWLGRHATTSSNARAGCTLQAC